MDWVLSLKAHDNHYRLLNTNALLLGDFQKCLYQVEAASSRLWRQDAASTLGILFIGNRLSVASLREKKTLPSYTAKQHGEEQKEGLTQRRRKRNPD